MKTNFWTPEEEKFLSEKYQYYSNYELAQFKELNRHTFTSIKDKAKILGLKRDSSFTNRIVKINAEKQEVIELKLENIDTAELLEEASRRGFLHTKRELVMNRTYEFPKKHKSFKLGIVSDTHLGSQLQQITLLQETYKYFKQEGITKVLHCGDLVEGNGKQYKGQLYEMFLHGADAMIDYAVKAYPKEAGITTYVIGGSHDYSFFKSEGNDILKKIAEKRPDIKYLGYSGAVLNFGNIIIRMSHPSGGVPYARSYRLQKAIEQTPAAHKPHIFLVGHLHVTAELPCYRNVAGFQLPCFQRQTQYLIDHNLNPDIGFLVLHIFPDEKGMAHYVSDWHNYPIPVEGDF